MFAEIDFEKICADVCGIARGAGGYIESQRKVFTRGKVELKGDHDPVSYVDREAERMVVSQLERLIPGAGFITEEGTVRSGMEREWKWIVDPLDGTVNFIHGLPPYCVSIALMRGAELVMGVVYEITRDEMFCAWSGSEARLNGEVIKAPEAETLSDALVAVGFSGSDEREVRSFLDRVDYFQKNSYGVRRTGSAAANIVYVASGRMEAFSQANLSAWDVAGGAFIAMRAGAAVSDFSGGDDFIFGREIVVCAPKIHKEFLRHVR